ncbi:MAG: DUF4476 domain-containing protein [Ignavibacteriales bacterium]|nr:DUF4476 domain-containing protein [Ignavibacteriales bacterium]
MIKKLFLFVFTFIALQYLYSQEITVQKNYDSQNPDERRRSDFLDLVNQIRAELQVIEDSYIKKLNFYERRDAIERLDNVLFLVDKIVDYKTRYNDPYYSPIVPMNDKMFADLLSKYNKKNFYSDAERIEYLNTASAYNYLFVDQVIVLLNYFSFESSKYSLLEKLYQRIVDRENSYEIIDEFTFWSYQDKAKKLLKL